MDLIARSVPVDAGTLADESTDLRALARDGRPAAAGPQGSPAPGPA
jgi:hypothetical protein